MTVAWDSVNRSSMTTLSGGNLTVTGSVDRTVGVAIDITNKLVWYRNGQTRKWNGSSTADPASGTGGISFTPGSGLFPMASADPSVSGNYSITANFGATSFYFPVPSGFSSWDSATSATNTWNPSDKNASVALSGGNLIATFNATSYIGVRATNSLSSGKAYYEFQWTTSDSNGFSVVGFGQSGASLSNYVGSTSSVSFGAQEQGSTQGTSGSWDALNYVTGSTLWSSVLATLSHSTGKYYYEVTYTTIESGAPHIGLTDGNIAIYGNYPGSTTHGISTSMEGSGVYYNGSAVHASDYTAVGGKTFGVAVDIDNALLWFWTNGTGSGAGNRWNAGNTADPNTGVGGWALGVTGALFPVIAPFHHDSVMVATANFGASAFVNPLPGGYSSWDGSQRAVVAGSAAFAGVGSLSAAATGGRGPVAASASLAGTGSLSAMATGGRGLFPASVLLAGTGALSAAATGGAGASGAHGAALMIGV